MPGRESNQWIKDIEIRNKGRFEVNNKYLIDAVEEVDLVVLDWPATSLLEVLSMHVPTIVLMEKNITFPNQEAMKSLEECAQVYYDRHNLIDDFENGIEQAFEKSKKLPQSDFLKKYAIGDEKVWDENEIFNQIDKRINQPLN